MSAKETTSALVNQLDDNASWADVKNTVMKAYRRETGDAKADAMAAVVLCAIFVCACIFWVSSQ
ncbi:MAG: hypothetical protein MK137_08305 [Rickettsiales bacterium]|nr:hypothetical protein [Rickettsiales bacterium]